MKFSLVVTIFSIQAMKSPGQMVLVFLSIKTFHHTIVTINDFQTDLLQGKENKIIFIQVYFPTSNHPDNEAEVLYDEGYY